MRVLSIVRIEGGDSILKAYILFEVEALDESHPTSSSNQAEWLYPVSS